MSKKILITGASSGLGLSHAIYLASKGYNITGTSRNAENIDLKILKEIFIRDHTKYRLTGSKKNEVLTGKCIAPEMIIKNLDDYLNKIKYVSMDITDDASVIKAVEKIESSGPVDILVNNAGIAGLGSFEETNFEDIKKMFEVNYFGHIRTIKAVLPYMRKRMSGFIINTTSLASIAGLPFTSFYSASKSGMERITESLYTELKQFNILVSSLLPGDINTSIDANMVARYCKKGMLSTDIQKMIDEVPASKNSPYYSRVKILWEIFITNHIIAPSPFTVSKKLLTIIETQKPKIHYISGSFIQATMLPLLKAILPENSFLDVVAGVFGL